ncbi:MAG: hypothetical protein PHV33_01795 [Elusimicrobiales bacterium]|nr:hypothetical protein [Elusimicrobiales bacterium]
MFQEDNLSKYSLYLGFFLTLLGYSGRYTGIEPVNNQFFPFALWSFILLADNLAWRFKNDSPLISRPVEFYYLALWSLGLAALAELLNLRLGAWHYLNQASDQSTRWGGRLFAWAGALPSIFVLDELFKSFGFFRGLKSAPFKLPAALPRAFLAAGAALALLALAAPSLFWPLLLPAVFLLAEPLNLRLGLPSLTREVAGGLPAKAARLAAAGLAMGLLWNWWNRAGGSGWEYALPAWLAPLPAAAYAGFVLLGPACYSLYSLTSWLRAGRNWEEVAWTMPGPPPPAALRRAAAALLPLACYLALRAVDAHTVRLYLGWV